jgi:hypothetical protein
MNPLKAKAMRMMSQPIEPKDPMTTPIKKEAMLPLAVRRWSRYEMRDRIAQSDRITIRSRFEIIWGRKK